MYHLIILEDDAFGIEKFQQEETIEPILETLREWTIEAIGKDDLGSEVAKVKQMSLGELAERFDAYCWGENNLKRVHVIQTADELQTIL